MRILVIPERLDDLSRQMTQAAGELRDLEGRLGRALGGLDWQVRQQATVEGQVRTAQHRARMLAESAERMARYLADKARVFREVDHQGAAQLPKVPIIVVGPLPIPAPPRLPWPFPRIPSIPRLPRIPWPFPRIPIPWPPRIILIPPRIPSFPLPSPKPRPTPPPPRPKSPSQPVPSTPSYPTESKPKVKLEDVRPENYHPKNGCVRYAQDRRPDLGLAPDDGEEHKGGAADYLDKPDLKDKIFQVKDGSERIEKGYAIVWEKGHPALGDSAGKYFGHIAIVEDVVVENGVEYVIVSQAGVGPEPGPTIYPTWSMRMKIRKSELIDKKIHIIGA